MELSDDIPVHIPVKPISLMALMLTAFLSPGQPNPQRPNDDSCGSVRPGKISVSACVDVHRRQIIMKGSTSREVVHILLCRQRRVFAGCCKMVQTSGKLTVRFTIQSSGLVSDVSEVDSTIKGKRLKKCLLGKIRSLRFPSSPGIDIVTLPMLIGRPGQNTP